MNSFETQKQIEAQADKLFEEKRYREASDLYGQCYRPFRGLNHMVNISKKQMTSLRAQWSLDK